MAAPVLYFVISGVPVTVDDGGSVVSYPPGVTFYGNPNNPSILNLLQKQQIITATSGNPVTPPNQPNSNVGPPGPPGPAGGPAGSQYSVKIRGPLGTYPITIATGASLTRLTLPVGTEVLYDPSNMFAPAPSDRLTVKTGASGRYHVEGVVRFFANATGYRHVEIIQYSSVDVVKDKSVQSVGAVSGDDTAVSISSDFDAVPGDYFTIETAQTSGSSLALGFFFSAMLEGSGPAGSTGPAGAGFNFRGAWSGVTAYVQGDVVSFGTNDYVTNVNVTGTSPPSSPWQVFLQGGNIGPAGGDLGGSYPNPTVTSVAHVTTGVLGLSNGGTGNTTGQPSGTAGGDLSGSYPSPTVATVGGTAAATIAANLPSTTQKAALAGTSGTPGAGNKYVTDQDPRLANSGATLNIVNQTADFSLTESDAGSIQTNTGATIDIQTTAPVPNNIGKTYEFLCLATHYLKINLPANVTVYIGKKQSAVAGFFRSNVPGSRIRITLVASTIYSASPVTGHWYVDQ